MKNPNLQFKATTLRYKKTGLLLVCLAAVFILAPNPASARDQVPFNATLSGYVETSEFLPPCTIHGHAIVFGNATHLGAYTGTGELYQDVCNSTYIGSFHWFAANDDEIYGTFAGYLTPTGTPGVYDNHETADVTGATGHWESGGANRLHHGADIFCYPLARVDLNCRLERARKLKIVRRPILRIATSVRLVAMR